MQCPETGFYEKTAPYNSGWLKVSKIHEIYYEEIGIGDGIPIVALHGGPGSAITDLYRRLFNPKVYRVVLFDQRGCGKSTPSCCLTDNETSKLVEDMEALRQHLQIDKWLVFGHSWGTTLGLFYTEIHPERVLGLVVQGVFTFQKEEEQWMYQNGASQIFPEHWENFIKPIPIEERNDILGAYMKQFLEEDPESQKSLEYAKALKTWNTVTSMNRGAPEELKEFESAIAEAKPRNFFIFCYYSKFQGFLQGNHENPIWRKLHIIRESKIRVIIVHGRYDVMTPMKTAWRVHKSLPESEFHVVPEGGHNLNIPAISKKLVEILDNLATLPEYRQR